MKNSIIKSGSIRSGSPIRDAELVVPNVEYLVRAAATEVFEIPVPWLLGICLDCTKSISQPQFRVAQNKLTQFLLAVHRRSTQSYPPDLVALTAFKDHRQIFGPDRTPVVSMDRAGEVGAMCDWVSALRADGRLTALYDAVVIAAAELVEIDEWLRYEFLKTVIVITDGINNDSKASLDDLSFFENSSINLAVIGVGNACHSQLKSLERYAAITYGIHGFEGLMDAMTFVMRGAYTEYYDYVVRRS